LCPGDVKPARGNGGESQTMGAHDETAQPGPRTATSIKNGNRARTGSPQAGQFRFKESPEVAVGIGMQTVKGIQTRWIAIGIRDVITTSLIVGRCDICGRTVLDHRTEAM